MVPRMTDTRVALPRLIEELKKQRKGSGPVEYRNGITDAIKIAEAIAAAQPEPREEVRVNAAVVLDADFKTGSLHMTDQGAWSGMMAKMINEYLERATQPPQAQRAPEPRYQGAPVCEPMAFYARRLLAEIGERGSPANDTLERLRLAVAFTSTPEMEQEITSAGLAAAQPSQELREAAQAVANFDVSETPLLLQSAVERLRAALTRAAAQPEPRGERDGEFTPTFDDWYDASLKRHKKLPFSQRTACEYAFEAGWDAAHGHTFPASARNQRFFKCGACGNGPIVEKDIRCEICAPHTAQRALEPREERDALVAEILEVAQLSDDTDKGGTVFMPDEDEWGAIVGLARKAAQ